MGAHGRVASYLFDCEAVGERLNISKRHLEGAKALKQTHPRLLIHLGERMQYEGAEGKRIRGETHLTILAVFI